MALQMLVITFLIVCIFSFWASPSTVISPLKSHTFGSSSRVTPSTTPVSLSFSPKKGGNRIQTSWKGQKVDDQYPNDNENRNNLPMNSLLPQLENYVDDNDIITKLVPALSIYLFELWIMLYYIFIIQHHNP